MATLIAPNHIDADALYVDQRVLVRAGQFAAGSKLGNPVVSGDVWGVQP
ncbi:MAG: hypothetical protein Q8N13_23995 [Acidovorax sp.]|nr:hypothetical protein [Acidovorax sp.]